MIEQVLSLRGALTVDAATASSRGLSHPRKMWRFLTVLLLVGEAALAAPPLEETFEKTYPVPANVTLTVRNTDGTIYIYGAEPDELKITARKKAYSKARLDGIEIKVSIEGATASIETVYPPGPKGLSMADRSGTVDYIILVPETCTIAQAELGDGEIILQDLRGGGAQARLTNGRVIARDCFCDVRLAVAAGGIDVYYNWWEERRFAFFAEIGHGNLRMQLPPHPTLRVDAVSPSGNVRNVFAHELERNNPTHDLKTTIGDDNGAEFILRAASGNIEIKKGY